MNTAQLTPTMKTLQKWMANRPDKAVHRHAGGFWQAATPTRYDTFGTSTVEALVSRGVAYYSNWTQGRNGAFPIRATLTRHCANCGGPIGTDEGFCGECSCEQEGCD